MKKADYFFTNARVVNVYSGEILMDNIAVSGDRILYVGKGNEFVGPDTEVMDAEGDYILPGFFDAHAHADLFYNPFSFANYVVTGGTTGFFNDGHDLANALGADSFLEIMEELSKTVISAYTGVPAASAPYPEVEGEDLWGDEDLDRAMDYPNVLSLSEVTPYVRVVNGDEVLKRRFALARRKGRFIEGHTTGADSLKLNVLAEAGITSCHEALNSDDVLARLRLGYYVMLRHGSILQDLPRFIEAVDRMKTYDTSRIMLVSDGIFPDHLVSRGSMDWVVTEAIRFGVEPVRAIQMATLNPARYFRLDDVLGGIAPGRLAHVLITPSLETPVPRFVMAGGVPVADEGKLIIEGLPSPSPGLRKRPFKIRRVSPEIYRVQNPRAAARVPVIRIVNKTVTALEEVEISSRDGYYLPRGDILTISLMTRDGRKMGKGFVKGFCPGLGAVASSIAHETHGILVVGQNEEDMAMAANDVIDMGGGISLVHGGIRRAGMALAIGGIASEKSIPDLSDEIVLFHTALKELGCSLEYPLWTLGFLSFTSVLKLRITYSGVYDVKKQEIIF